MSQSPQPLRRRRNVAKLLARLNPKGLGLPNEGGRGTAGSTESAIDIAAALGYVSRGNAGRRLAVTALCLRWWPAHLEGPNRVVGYREVEKVVKTTRITGEREKTASAHPTIAGATRHRMVRRTDVHTVVERIPVERPIETPAFRALANLIATRLGQRAARCWKAVAPGISDGLANRVLQPVFLQAWARAVIHEYRFPNVCQSCNGYGEALKIIDDPATGKPKANVVACEHCWGAGVTAWSSKRRGKALTISEHSFRNHLAYHHDGALELLRELESRGAGYLVARLGLSDER